MNLKNIFSTLFLIALFSISQLSAQNKKAATVTKPVPKKVTTQIPAQSKKTITDIPVQQKKVKVLFVGNSFTYYHNLPQVVAAMSEVQEYKIETRQSTVGGSSLEDHWEGLRETKTRVLIDTNKWDFIVFNNHSLSAINDKQKFLDYSKKFADLAREKGAIPIFMITWAYKSNPLMQPEITKMYQELSELTKADIVPCGPLFAMSRRERPDLNLFDDDKHPSSNGTYLLGLSFFKYFTGKKTDNIPSNLYMNDKDGEKLYLIFTDKTDSNFFKQMVNEFPYKTNSFITK